MALSHPNSGGDGSLSYHPRGYAWVGNLSTRQQAILQVEEDLQHHTQTLLGQVHLVHQLALEKLEADLAGAKYIVATEGTPTLDEGDRQTLTITNQVNQQVITVDIPTLKIGNQVFWNNPELVDRMKSSSQLTATIFQYLPEGLLRISTNVLNRDQTRAVGTFIPPDSPVYQAIAQGQSYRGRAFVVNDWYLGVYDPIKDSGNRILGALYVGVPESYYQESIKQSFEKIVLGETGYIFILNPVGDYVLSAQRQRDGENILQSQDEDGRYFIQEIVTQGQQLANQATGLIYYPWRNPGEQRARRKLAVYGYFPAWEWIIGASAYQEEFLHSLRTLRTWTFSICVMFLLITTLIAYQFSRLLGRAITQIVHALNQIADGQLQTSSQTAFATNREFNQIFATLARTQYQLRSMVGQIASAAQNMSVTAQALTANVDSVTLTVDHVVASITELEQTQQTNHLARGGERSARHAEQGMRAISASFGASAEAIASLDQKTVTIQKMATLIHDVSQQTNLLALNAAIEATRTGESGQGFAVVAREIRRLSDEVKASADEIQQSLTLLMDTVKHASNTVKVGYGEVSLNSQVIGEALTALTDVSQQVESMAVEVARLKRTEEISRSMGDVAAVVTSLSRMAQDLQGLVNQFHW